MWKMTIYIYNADYVHEDEILFHVAALCIKIDNNELYNS